jgi:hypothetical protein
MLNVVHGLWEVDGLISLINLDNQRDRHLEVLEQSETICKYSAICFHTGKALFGVHCS